MKTRTVEAGTDFEAIAGLSATDLEDLLRHGTPIERVHAAWALALRIGADFGVDSSLRSEPNPGVRRHLLVIAAGQQRRDIVRLLSESDPSAIVRSHAVRLRWQSCPAEERASESAALVDLGLREESVRESLLDALGEDFPASKAPALDAFLDDADRGVRELALHRTVSFDSSPALSKRVTKALDGARDADELRALVRIVWERCEQRVVGRVLADCGRAAFGELSRARDRRLAWEAMAPAFERGDLDREATLLDWIEDVDAIEVTTLAGRIVGSNPSPDDWSALALRKRCIDLLRARSIACPSISSAERSALADVVRTLTTLARDELARLDAGLDLEDPRNALARAEAMMETGELDLDPIEDAYSDEFETPTWFVYSAERYLAVRDALETWIARG